VACECFVPKPGLLRQLLQGSTLCPHEPRVHFLPGLDARLRLLSHYDRRMPVIVAPPWGSALPLVWHPPPVQRLGVQPLAQGFAPTAEDPVGALAGGLWPPQSLWGQHPNMISRAITD
jgi:hypothetical protein